MKFFNKSEGAEKVKNQFLLKRGAYTAALIAIVLAAVVALNVFSTVIARRFPTNIDLSATGTATLSKDNIKYIEDVKQEVNVVVCATKDGYISQEMAEKCRQNYYLAISDGTYLEQTQRLLEQYTKYNKNIKVTYSDPDAASFNSVQKIVENTTLYYGDVLVYCTRTNDKGEQTTNARIVRVTDMYESVQDYNYMDYAGNVYSVITGSNVETAITSAIYGALSEKSNTVALLSGIGGEKAFDGLWANLTLNNYDVVEVTDKILTSIPKEADIVALAAPTRDLSAVEIDILEKFLDNGGEKGKNLMVFCDGTKSGYPNLYAFLAEWGANVLEEKLVYETDSSFYYYVPTCPLLLNLKSDYTDFINKDELLFVSTNIVPMEQAFETKGNRVSNVLFATTETTVAAPMDIDVYKWAPSASDEKKSYAVAIYTHDTVYDGDLGAKSSGVFVCSSADFIAEDWNAVPSVGNVKSVVSVLNNLCGRDTTEIYFNLKVAASTKITPPTAAAEKMYRIVFVVLLPIAVMAAGIFVWIRRSRR